MPRLVVLDFDDNEQAEEFIESGKYNVVGLFARPSLFCDPSDGHTGGRGKTGRGWTKGKKYGWWVCAVCKKPSRLWGEKFECVVGNGKNLLKEFLCSHPEEAHSTGDGSHYRCKDCGYAWVVKDEVREGQAQ